MISKIRCFYYKYRPGVKFIDIIWQFSSVKQPESANNMKNLFSHKIKINLVILSVQLVVMVGSQTLIDGRLNK